jgi:MYXO-CTERM domain-containing protein
MITRPMKSLLAALRHVRGAPKTTPLQLPSDSAHFVRVSLTVVAVLTAAATASADVTPVVLRYAPVRVTLDGKSAFEDTILVVLGCHSSDGRHQLALVDVSSTEPLECKFKPPPTPMVYAVSTRDIKPLTDLLGQDLGVAVEGGKAKGLLEKSSRICGALEENSLLNGRAKGPVAFFSARYALSKTASGCSLKKVDDTVTHAPEPTAAPALGSADAAPSASSTPLAKSGCGCREAGTRSGPGTVALVMAALLATAFARRRRP